MTIMTAGRAVARALIEEGIDTVFGIPGAQNLEIYDGFLDCRDEIEQIVARHECSAGFMADGYARAGGRIGVSVAIGGPGLTNSSTALGQAFSDSSPLLLISTQTSTNEIDRDIGVHHQLLDQLGHTSGVTAWNRRITDPAEVPVAIGDAVDYMCTHRPRPVHIEIPGDILVQEADMTFGGRTRPDPPVARDDEIEAAAEILVSARRPLLWIGGGAAGAAAQLTELAEISNAAVIMTGAGKGIVREDHRLSLGSNLRSQSLAGFVASTDAVLVVGSQLAAQETAGGQLEFPADMIRVDIDAEGDCLYDARIRIVSDAADFADRLLPRIRRRLAERSSRDAGGHLGEIARLKSRLAAEDGLGGEAARGIIRALRDTLPEEAVLVGDMTMLCYRATAEYPALLPRTYLFPRGFGTLGWSLPAAIGAKVAAADHPVVSVCGDGGFLYTAQELATAVMCGLSIPILILNDSSYGMVKRFQKMRYGPDRVIATDLYNPDFVRFAESFGVRGTKLRDESEIPSALTEALRASGPTVLQLDVGF
ncbi:MAG: thiamine pyrophosphate-binding protein [Bacillota bacterium]